MKNTFLLLILVGAGLFSGCTAPGQAYAKSHPDLPAAQLQFLKTGKIPDGTAIAGMTREQVQIAMGIDPTQYTKVDGKDAWVYVRKNLSANNNVAGQSELDRRDARNRGSLMDTDFQTSSNQPLSKTTIYFDGDVATHAETVPGGL